MITSSNYPLITQEFIKFVMKDILPGCRLKINPRMGGTVLSMAVWHYSIVLSLTTLPITLTDKIGETQMTLIYQPKEIQAEKPIQTIILRRDLTFNPDEVKQFLKDVRAYLRGIVQAINTATDTKEGRAANIFTDDFGNG